MGWLHILWWVWVVWLGDGRVRLLWVVDEVADGDAHRDVRFLFFSKLVVLFLLHG